MSTTSQTVPTVSDAAAGVDARELARHIAQMYRAVADGDVADLHFHTGRAIAQDVGYPAEVLDRLPAGAVTSFAGVGHHFDLARLAAGERVLDLGSGSGMDVFAAALAVGPQGSVTGVDITPEQRAKAEGMRREEHVAFRAARIEELPFDDGSFDAVISNGVVNLSADKPSVFAEAFRVLRPGGRLALADIVTDRAIAVRTAAQPDLWAACIAGASQRTGYLRDVVDAGFEVRAVRTNPAYHFASDRAKTTSAKYGAHTIELLAVKPAGGHAS